MLPNTLTGSPRMTLTSAELELLLDQMVPILNARINIPGIWDEEQEAARIESALRLIFTHLPGKAWPYLLNASNGLTDAETEEIIEITLNSIARAVVAPLPSFVHAFISSQIHDAFEAPLRIVMEYAQAGANLGLDEPEGEVKDGD